MRSGNVLRVFCVLGCAVCGAFGGESVEEKAAIAALRAKLQKPITVRMIELKTERALELVAKQADVKLRITDKEKGKAYEQPVSMAVKDVRALDVLTVICDIAGLYCAVGPRSVDVNSGTGGEVVMRIYDVSDLTRHIQDFWYDPEPLGNAPHPMPFEVAPTSTLTNVADMIRNRVRPESWDAALGTSIEERAGKLVVMQTEEVHALIRGLFGEFRASQARQAVIDARVLTAKCTDLDRIRRELATRGGCWPDLDDAAVAAIESLVRDGVATQLFSGSCVACNTQGVSLSNYKVQPYLADYDVSGDQYDPAVKNLHTGAFVLARPHISDDGRLVTLRLSVTHATETEPLETVEVIRRGLVTTRAGSSTITVRRNKPDAAKEGAPKEEGKPAAGAKPAEDGKPGGEAKPAAEDITSDFTITSEGKGEAAVGTGPLQIQLPTLAVARIYQNLVLQAGRYAAVSAPLGAKDGLAHGQELVALVRCTPTTVAAPQPRGVYRREPSEAVQAKLDRKVSFSFNGTPFQEAIATVATQLDIPVVMDTKRLDPATMATALTLEIKDVTGAIALEWILRLANAGSVAYSSLLLITKRDRAAGRNVTLRVLDIRDMTSPIPDYRGPAELGISHENVGVADPFANPNVSVTTSAADIATMLKDKLFPADFGDPNTSIEESGGRLVVMQTRETHAKLAQAIERLRRTLLRRVAVHARWAVVNTADLKAATGTTSAGILDATQTEKVLALLAQPGARDISAARIACFSGQRVSVYGGIERRRVRDYDISGDLYDPYIITYLTGAVLEIRPDLAGGEDGAKDVPTGAMLEVRARLSHMEHIADTFDPIAPGAAAQQNDKQAQPPGPKPAEPPAPAKPAEGQPQSAPAAPRNDATTLPYPPPPGKVHTPHARLQPVAATVRVPNGGAALFRLPVPEWLAGEEAEAARKGERTLIVIIQAEELKY